MISSTASGPCGSSSGRGFDVAIVYARMARKARTNRASTIAYANVSTVISANSGT
jgi:hypothetical protein